MNALDDGNSLVINGTLYCVEEIISLTLVKLYKANEGILKDFNISFSSLLRLIMLAGCSLREIRENNNIVIIRLQMKNSL